MHHLFPVHIAVLPVVDRQGLGPVLDSDFIPKLYIRGNAIHQVTEGQTVVIELLPGFVVRVIPGVGLDCNLVVPHLLEVFHVLFILPLDHGHHNDH